MIRLKGIYVFEALCFFVPNEHLNLGFGGGEVHKISDDSGINIPTPKGEYGIVENIHLMMCHYLIDSLNETLKQ